MNFKFSISIILLFAVNMLQAQEDKGTFNGNFSSNTQFFRQDDRIGANTELYKRQLVGSEAWLSTNYTQKGLTLQARFDLFNNSNLYDPSTAYTGSGIGYWSIIKEIDNIQITGGYFYEQFATGTVFRAFEDRALGLDYAIQGVRVKYTPFKDFKIKAFTGKQKFRFGIRDQVMRGANAEWSWHNKKETFGWEPGSSILNRTIDNGTMPTIVNIINDQPGINQFYPKYNVYLFNFYNAFGATRPHDERLYHVFRDLARTENLRGQSAVYAVTKSNYFDGPGSYAYGKQLPAKLAPGVTSRIVLSMAENLSAGPFPLQACELRVGFRALPDGAKVAIALNGKPLFDGPPTIGARVVTKQLVKTPPRQPDQAEEYLHVPLAAGSMPVRSYRGGRYHGCPRRGRRDRRYRSLSRVHGLREWTRRWGGRRRRAGGRRSCTGRSWNRTTQ